MTTLRPKHNQDTARPAVQYGENQVIWTIWLTYGAFYFCRTNLAAALPGIENEFGYDKVQLSYVLLALKFSYGLGQFFNGQFAERLSPRIMLAIGMFGSAALNIAFGFGTGLYFFLFVWAMNGYCQSLGWTPCVRVLGNWVPIWRRGYAMGIVGTGYQLTAGLTFLFSGVAVSVMGWRGAVWAPPAILITAAVIMLLFLREKPPNDDPIETVTDDPSSATANLDAMSILWGTLSNRALWLLALALGMLNACRYGFIDWGVSHLVDIEEARMRADSHNLGAPSQGMLNTAVLSSAVKYAILPIGGVLGSLWAGWASDRFFGCRRSPVICGMLVVLGCLTLGYDAVARASFLGTLFMLLAIGFTIFGPQVLLVGTAPADLAKDGTAAAAAGFVNCMGYFGAAILGDLLTGYLAENYGWNIAILVWAGWAFLAAAMVALLWNQTGYGENATASA